MKNKIIAVSIMAVVFAAASFFYLDSAEENIPPPEIPAPKKIAVYVSGQVKTPAVVKLDDTGNLRAVDAVNAVGGLTEFADTEIINLAEPIFDGQHIHIPTKDIIFAELPAGNSPATKSLATNSSQININTADETELQKIRGVGPVIAGRIVEYRQQNGAFQTIDDIKKVRGIGVKTFDKIKDSITVN